MEFSNGGLIAALPFALVASAAGLLLLLWKVIAKPTDRGLAGARARWQHAGVPVAIALASIALWELCYAGELASSSRAAAIRWHQLAYLGTCCVSPAFLWAMLAASRRDKPVPSAGLAALWSIPVVSLGLLAVGSPLFWVPTELLSAGPLSAIDTQRGPWFWVHTGYSYACLGLGSLTVLRVYSKTWRSRKREALAVMAGVVAPWAANGLHLFLDVGNAIDITALSLMPSGLLMYWVVGEDRLQAILPIAHAAILDQMDDSLFIIDRERQIVSANQRARGILTALDASASQPIDDAWPELGRLAERAPNQGIVSAPDSDGDARHYDARVSRIAGSAGLLAVAVRDVTEQVLAEAVLSARATRDELTGLANRASFRDSLVTLLASDTPGMHALLLFDLDGFKIANDTLGHAAGDELLRQVGAALASGIRATDVCTRIPAGDPSRHLARLGGDEFAILLVGLDAPDDAGFIAERLLEDIENQPKRWDVHASVGIAVTPGDAKDPDDLFRAADAALYHAKSLGGGRAAFFRPQFNAAADRRHKLEQRLARATGGEGLRLCYQPKIEVGTGRLVGLEALLRWTDEELGPVGPGEFIPISERTGAVKHIGRWVIESACRQIRSWRAAGLSPPPVAVNVASSQLRERGFYEHLTRTLAEHALPPSALEIEITESTLLSPDSETVDVLSAIRAIGIRVWLDDFGTGYSSLSYLNSFQLDGLKLDQSFVRGIDSDRTARSIAIGVVSIAKRLGLTVVAEGVETEPEAKQIELLEADEIQGFLYAKPLEVADAAKFIERGAPRRRT